MEKVKVLIAEDNDLIRRALCLLAGSFRNVLVVGEARNGREAVELSVKLVPEIVLMDLKMPVLDGVSATREIKKALPRTKIIALSAVDNGPELVESIEAGMEGYVLKSNSSETLRDAIEAVAGGGNFICPEVSEAMTRSKEDEKSRQKPKLSPREFEVIELICKGLQSKAISDQLGISVRTVEKHRDSIHRKYKNNSSMAGIVSIYLFEKKRRV